MDWRLGEEKERSCCYRRDSWIDRTYGTEEGVDGRNDTHGRDGLLVLEYRHTAPSRKPAGKLFKFSLLEYTMLSVVQDLKTLAAHVLLDVPTKSASVHPVDVEAPVSSSSGFILTRELNS